MQIRIKTAMRLLQLLSLPVLSRRLLRRWTMRRWTMRLRCLRPIFSNHKAVSCASAACHPSVWRFATCGLRLKRRESRCGFSTLRRRSTAGAAEPFGRLHTADRRQSFRELQLAHPILQLQLQL